MKGTYGKSSAGNFEVIDTIGVPHSYCIGSRHVVHASDHFGGMLGEEAILSAEQQGIYCCECRGKLRFQQHEQALLVACHKDFQTDQEAKQELHQYLLGIKDECEKNGYAGFAFIRK